jgi:hypothetical protein
MQDREYAARLVNTLIDNVRRGEVGATAYRDLIIDELDRGMAAQDRERAKTPEPVSNSGYFYEVVLRSPSSRNMMDMYLALREHGFHVCHVKLGTQWRSGDGNGLERLVK